MGAMTVDGTCRQLVIDYLKVSRLFRVSRECSGADWREVIWMGEERQPFATVVHKGFRVICGQGADGRHRLVDVKHEGVLDLCVSHGLHPLCCDAEILVVWCASRH